MNPQFQVEIGSDTNEKEAMLVVGVMQKDDRMKRLETGAEIPAIGYFIFDACFFIVWLVIDSWSKTNYSTMEFIF